MPADNELDPLDRWLNQQVRPLPPPDGTFELITRRARRRRIRKTVVSVASGAAVVAAVAVAVPVGMSLHLTTGGTSASLAAGSNAKAPAAGTQSTLGTGVEGRVEPAPSASSPVARASASAAPTGGAASHGYLPSGFSPASVTWDSLSTGWVIGPAGTPGHCANSDPSICTSVARTDDGGQTWQGLPAPPVGGPMTATGVTGLRFLNATYGWAFGPELWATDDGGRHWHKVNTGSSSVTDLETASGRAYALFADCAPPAGTTGDTIANCTSYTLKTATAGSDNWTPVGGVPAALSPSGSATGSGTPGSATQGSAGQRGSAVIEFAGATAKQAATGYLVAPDGTLYAGPLDGTAWHQVAALPCRPGPAATSGLPQDALLAPAGTTSSGGTRLALVCAQPGAAGTVVYLSTDNGSTWAKQTAVGSSGLSQVGTPRSLTTLPDGTLILATEGSGTASGGIYLLAPGASAWQAATLSNPSGKTYGFTYVGMTSAAQGVALGGNPNLHAIWMTTDGGKTWQVRPIKS